MNGNVLYFVCNSQQKSADVGEGVGVTEHLVNNIALAGKVAHDFEFFGLADKPLSHFVVDLAAEVPKARVHFVLILRKNQVAGVVKRVDQLEHLVGGGLSVVVKSDRDVARYERKARHYRRMLAEVAREVNALDVRIFLGKLCDSVKHLVGRAVVYEDYLVIVSAVRLNGADYLADDRAYSVFRAVARNYKR